MSSKFLTFLFFISVHTANITNAFTAPTMGIGAILFKPKNMAFEPSIGDDTLLVNAARFFTDAFWANKNPNLKELSSKQRISLSQQQVSEFRRRYGLKLGKDRRSELIVCQNKESGEVMGCAGIEVSNISTPNGKSIQFAAPLMSNLAVGRKFRRKGIAEDLVKATEQLALKSWGYDECYLYVEKANTPAVKLYRKLGYVKQWEDDTATSLIPTSRGNVVSTPTVIVCMKKSLRGGLSLGRFLPFGS